MNDLRFDGQVALVTGAGRGLGRAHARLLAARGCTVVVNDLGSAFDGTGAATGRVADEVVALIQAEGGKATANYDSVENGQAIIDDVMATHGRLDIVINNAGVATGGSLEGESLEQWQWIMDINLLSMVRVCQTFYPAFVQQGGGYFINIASQAGLTPIPFMSSYNAVKAAVIGFSETLKLELAHDNIDVSVVCPSFFKTNLDESMRTSEPAMKTMLNRAFERSPINAEQVADIIYTQSLKRPFLILTHKLGKQAFLMKKLLPVEWYIKSMLKKTRSMQRLKSK